MALLFLLLSLLQVASAHFHVDYPYWRGNSYKTQWERPCGGINVTTNRTQWPLEGGSILFAPTHPWAITYVNLGLGSENVIFNISLVPAFNQTGNGTLCLPKVTIPKGTPISAGTNASLQIIQLSELGSALYNCADITFSNDPKLLASDQCKNSTDVGAKPLGASSTTSGAASGSSAAPSATKSGAASGSMFDQSKSTFAMGLAGVLVAFMGNLL